MNTQRLKDIEGIFHVAVVVPPAEREIFVNKHCGEDEDLRREVESLLNFEQTSESFLETPPESLAAQIFIEAGSKLNPLN